MPPSMMRHLSKVTACVLAAYAWLKPYGKRAAILATLVMALCTVGTFRLGIKEDISALIPTTPPELAERFTYLQRAPFMHFLTVALSCEGQTPEALAEQFTASLKAEAPYLDVYTGPGKAFLPKHIAELCSLAPNLLGPDEAALLHTLLQPGYIEKALTRDFRRLVSPDGMALRGLVALDPLAVCPMLMASAQKSGTASGFRVQQGHFTDATGRYALALIRPQGLMTDSGTSVFLMAAVEKAIAMLPEGTRHIVAGSYRHSASNAQIVKEDLRRVLPVSSLLIVLLFLLFIRKWQALSLLMVPFAAFGVAGISAAALLGGISGIVLGFGSVLLGITADYAVHTYFSIRTARSVESGLKDVLPPLATAMATTSIAFAVLLFSSIPAMRQMAVFALSGVVAAFLFSLFLLPQLLKPEGADAPSSPDDNKGLSLHMPPVIALTAVFLLVIALSLLFLRTDGDIRSLAYTSQELRADEEALESIRQTGGHSLIVAVGTGTTDGLEQALRMNDAVYGILQQAQEVPEESIASIAPFLPSLEKQEQGRALWQGFWQKNASTIRQDLLDSAAKLGFAPDAFAPFMAWTDDAPETITLERLQPLGLSFFLDMAVSRNADSTLVYTTLTGDAELLPKTIQALEDTGACILSPSSFREDMGHASGRDMLLFCSFTLFAVILATGLVFRSLKKTLVVLLPMLSGFAFTLTLFYCTGTAVNLFHGAALPLVIALSVDYGIFMSAVLEGKLERQGKQAVLFSGLTTLAGFGCLLLARHPALFSLGLAVSGGMAAALATAVWGLPLLAKKPRAQAL